MCIILKTERLIIRPISENDIENVFELQSLEQTSEFNTSKPPSNINETKINVDKWIDENNKENIKHFTFAIELIDEEKFMIEEDATRINLYFKKVKHTPNKYPRAYGQIKKKPLEG